MLALSHATARRLCIRPAIAFTRRCPLASANFSSRSNTEEDVSSADAAREYTNQSMPDSQFNFMRDILAAQSPVGLEASMTRGVIEDHFVSLKKKHTLEDWKLRTFQGNAGVVWESSPREGSDDKLNVMVIGHADKIRMQVRSIGKDGKIWINTDSFLPITLLGNEVQIFSATPETIGSSDVAYRSFNATAEAVGAIHFAPAAVRNGKGGLKDSEIYLELGLHGKDRQKQVEELGIRVGDPVLLNRPIQRCVAPNTFSGAYLDNGLGCFVTAEVARLIAERNPELASKVNCQFAFSSHEEIGRYGSRICVAECKPDVLIAVDVNHDYEAAPRVSSSKFQPLTMGLGMTLSVGSIVSFALNNIVEHAASKRGIPVQLDARGRDTGTDGMAGVFGNIDCAATSVGFPIRNMHTISELGHTGDLIACIEAMYANRSCALSTSFVFVALLGLVCCCSYGTIEDLADGNVTKSDLQNTHPRLDGADAYQP